MKVYVLSLCFIVLVLKTNASFSQCPSLGQYGYKCNNFDYCNKSMNLVCDDGQCGRICPSTWYMYNNDTCLLPVFQNLTYSAALASCRSQGAELVTIKSEDKMNFVKNIANILRERSFISNVWTGMIVTAELEYYWLDGAEVPMNDTNWSKGSPNNYDNAQRCVLLVSLNNDWVYNDYPCPFKEFSFICEIVMQKCPIGTCKCSPSTYLNMNQECEPLKIYNQSCRSSQECDASVGLICQTGFCKCNNTNTRWYVGGKECRSCPSGFKYFLDSCYYFNKAIYLDYDSSENNCKKFNSELSRIDTTAKFNAIRSFYEMYFNSWPISWIGAKSDGEEYYWSNGDILEYSNIWCNNTYDPCSLGCVTLSIKNSNFCISGNGNCSREYYSICEVEKFYGSTH